MTRPFFGQTALSSAPGSALATPSLATAAQAYMTAQKPNAEMLLELAKSKAAMKPQALKPKDFIALGNYGRGQPEIQEAIGQNFSGMQNFPYREAPKIDSSTTVESTAGGDKYKTAAPAAEVRANEAIKLKRLAAWLAGNKFREDKYRFDIQQPWREYRDSVYGNVSRANMRFLDPEGQYKPVVPPRGIGAGSPVPSPEPLPKPKPKLPVLPVVPKKNWADDWN